MKLFICSSIFVFFSNFNAFAELDPLYKEALQRGYTLIGDSVEFPDGTRCELNDFNAGNYGKNWLTEDYCIPEGSMVWDEDRCCEGLRPYLPTGSSGQAHCRSSKHFGIWQSSVYLLFVCIVLLIIFFITRHKSRRLRKKSRKHFGYYK